MRELARTSPYREKDMATTTTPSKTRSTIALGTTALVFGLLIGLVIGNWIIGILLGVAIMIQLTTHRR